MKAKWNIQTLIYTGMLAALGGVLMSLEFSVPMMPPFYKVDFSTVPSVIALFMLGPASAAWVEVIKVLIKLVTVGTNSMYVGELANLIDIALFVLPLWIIYRRMGQTRTAAAVSLSANVLLRTAFACFVNSVITLPLYAAAMGVSLDSVITMVSASQSRHHQPDLLCHPGHHPLQYPEAGTELLCGLSPLQPAPRHLP